MAFPQQLQDLQQEVLTLLSEATGSTIIDLRSGTGAASTITTLTNLTLLINEAQEEMCRTFYVLRDTATYASLPAGTQFVQFSNSNLVAATYNDLWAARSVSWNGTALTYCTATAIESHFPTWQTDATGTPLYWFPQGKDGVGIYPAPSSIHALVIAGLALPVRLVNATDVPVFNNDENKALVWQAAAHVAWANFSDPSVRDRADIWWNRWVDYATDRLDQVYAADPIFAAAHFTRPQRAGGPAGSVPSISSDSDA